MNQETLSRCSGESARRAITHYARAAAYEEKILEGNSAGQMWFVVRTMCAEHGVNYAEVTIKARQFVKEVGA